MWNTVAVSRCRCRGARALARLSLLRTDGSRSLRNVCTHWTNNYHRSNVGLSDVFALSTKAAVLAKTRRLLADLLIDGVSPDRAPVR